MATRSIRIRVLDIIDEIDLVGQALNASDLVAYQADAMMRRAVARYPDAPWGKIKGIGNILRHDYGRVDDVVIWRVAKESLPHLKHVTTEILAALPEEPEN